LSFTVILQKQCRTLQKCLQNLATCAHHAFAPGAFAVFDLLSHGPFLLTTNLKDPGSCDVICGLVGRMSAVLDEAHTSFCASILVVVLLLLLLDFCSAWWRSHNPPASILELIWRRPVANPLSFPKKMGELFDHHKGKLLLVIAQ